jgi:hypothetical protein
LGRSEERVRARARSAGADADGRRRPRKKTPPANNSAIEEAFEREYAGDHSWEALQEDEQGRLRPLVRVDRARE